MKHFVYVVISIVLLNNLYAQEYEEPLDDSSMLGEVEQEAVMLDEEQLEQWLPEPLNINSATKQEMMSIPGMTEHLAEEIIQRRTLKPYKHLIELRTLNGITPELYEIFQQCFFIEKKTKQYVKFHNRVERGVQLCKGFQNGAFLGSPYSIRTGIKANHTLDGSNHSYRSSIVVEKDAGERMRDAQITGYLHTEFSPSFALTLGHYVLQAGEGLVLGYPSMISRSVSLPALSAFSQTRVSPYSSCSPGWIFRGLAFQWQRTHSLLSMFYSNQYYNGTIDDQMNYASLDNTGYLRTVNELRKRNVLNEQAVGGIVTYTVEKVVTFGSVAYIARYNHQVALSSMHDTILTSFMYSGFVRIRLPRMSAGAEYAWDAYKRRAFSWRIVFQLSDQWNSVVGVRRYPEHFVSLHGNTTLATGSALCNEEGFSIGINGRIFENVSVSAFHDSHFQRDRTTRAQLYGSLEQYECNFKYTQNFTVSIRLKQRNSNTKQRHIDSYGRSQDVLCSEKVRKYHIQTMYTPTSKFTVANKFAIVQYSEQHNEHGMSIQQLLSYCPTEYFRLEASATVFQTKTYNSRIYTYEPNLPGYSTYVALYGEGIRWYGIVFFRPIRTITFSCKYLQLAKEGIHSYGSGNDTINGSVRASILFQLDCSL